MRPMPAIEASRSVVVDLVSSRAKKKTPLIHGYWNCASVELVLEVRELMRKGHAANGYRERWGVEWARGGANGRTSVWVIPNKLLLEGWCPGIMAEYVVNAL